jgi:fucose permease
MGSVGAGVLITVPGLLAEWHGEHAAAALGEANGFSYGASLLAALSTSLFLAIGLGWQSGLVLGAILVAILTGFAGRQEIPEAPPHPKDGKGHLSAAYWMYWLALAGAVGVEQTTLVWAPAFLEGAKDLSRSAAASGAALFSAGMLIGRVASAPLMARMSPTTALYGSFVLLLPAFAVYWGMASSLIALPGLFAVGLGTALLYPLILSQSIQLAGPLGDTASARASLASGIAILVFPLAVGSLADTAGLKTALMVVPVLAVVSLGCLVVGARMAVQKG